MQKNQEELKITKKSFITKQENINDLYTLELKVQIKDPNV